VDVDWVGYLRKRRGFVRLEDQCDQMEMLEKMDGYVHRGRELLVELDGIYGYGYIKLFETKYRILLPDMLPIICLRTRRIVEIMHA
jgi:hypothetical protein